MKCNTMKKTGLIGLLFLIFIFCSMFAYADDTLSSGYYQNQASSESYGSAGGFLGWTHANPGRFNTDYAQRSQFLYTITSIQEPLIIRMNFSQAEQYYVVGRTNIQNIQVQSLNRSTTLFDLVAFYIVPNPIIAPMIAFNSGQDTNIAVLTEGSTVNFQKINLLVFNGTSLYLKCNSSDVPKPSSAAGLIAYDSVYNEIVSVTGVYGASARVSLFDASGCTNISTNTVLGRLRMSSGGKYNSSGMLVIADLYGDGKHEVIFPHSESGTSTNNGFYVASYNNTAVIGSTSGFSGSDPYGLLGYTCLNGLCTAITTSTKITNPIYSPTYKTTVVAAENIATGLCGHYCLIAFDQFGNAKWYSNPEQTGYSLFNEFCAADGATENTVFYQPAFADSDGDGAADSACGACQPAVGRTHPLYANLSQKIFWQCFNIASGLPTAGGSDTLAKNYYQDDSLAKFPQYNALLAGKFSSSGFNGLYPFYDDILIRDRIYPHAQLVDMYDFSFQPSWDVIGHAAGFGSSYNQVPGEAKVPAIILSAKNFTTLGLSASNQMFYIAAPNVLPEFIGEFNLSPPTQPKPVCLNFARDQGIRVSYSASDADGDDIYARHFCDINTLGEAPYYNYTNWTKQAMGMLGSESISFETYYCRYNATGSITISQQISDLSHSNVSGQADTYNEQRVTYSIINDTFPNCFSDYSQQEDIITPPPEIQPNITETPQTCAGLTFNTATMQQNIRYTLCTFGIVTDADVTFFGFVMMILIALIVLVIGLLLHAGSAYYLAGIPIMLGLAFFMFVALGIFSVWMVVLLIILAALLGAFAFMRRFFQNSGEQ